MILTALILGATAIAGIGIIATFWNDIIDFLQTSIRKIQQKISGILYGAKVLLKKLDDGVKEISKHYSKENEVWNETIVTRTVSESEVPSEILARAKRNEELDITDELELQLG